MTQVVSWDLEWVAASKSLLSLGGQARLTLSLRRERRDVLPIERLLDARP